MDAADFGGTLPSGFVFFPEEETTATIALDIAGDTEFEPDEGLTVTLSNPVGPATELGNAAANVVVTNDDPEPQGVSDRILRGTDRSDVQLGAVGATLLPGDGEDVLLISEAAKADIISVFEGQQGDRVQLPGGLEIASSLYVSNALQIELENGARFQILEADRYTYEIGANAVRNETGRAVDLATFAEDLLGFALTESTLVTGDAATVPAPTALSTDTPVTPAAQTLGVVRGTELGDVMAVRPGAFYLGQEGDDTFILSKAITPGETSVIEGAPGYEIELIQGLVIESAVVLPDAIGLTLDSGAEVQILGASALDYDVGGDATRGFEGQVLDYPTFVEQLLGVPLPEEGFVTAGPVTIGAATLLLSNASGAEGDPGSPGRLVFPIAFDQPALQDSTFAVATADGTAVAGEDYVALDTTVTIPAGETSAEVAVDLVGDDMVEAEESFDLVLSSPGAPDLGSVTLTGTIENDDFAAISVSDASATEGTSASLDFTLSLDQASPVPVEVAVATADGTATAGADYTALDTRVTIPAGETTAQVSVPLLDDALPEPDETVSLQLSDPQNAEIADGTGEGTILDDEVPVTLIDAPATYVAEPEPEVFQVRMDSTAPDGYTNPDFDGNATIQGFDTAEDVLRFVEVGEEPKASLDEFVTPGASQGITFVINPIEQNLTYLFADDADVPGTAGAAVVLQDVTGTSPDFLEIA